MFLGANNTTVSGDLGMVTILKKGALRGDTYTAVKRTGAWLEVKAKAATGSKFGAYETGELFYILPGQTFTPTDGDSYYVQDESFLHVAKSWSVNAAANIIDDTRLGFNVTTSIEGRPTLTGSISCVLEQGIQPGVMQGASLPYVDTIEIERQYWKVSRTTTTSDTDLTTAIPKLYTGGDTKLGVFLPQKTPQRFMFYSITAVRNRGTVSCIYAAEAQWNSVTMGSGDAGALSEFELPLTFQEDAHGEVLRGYQHNFPVPGKNY